MDARNQPIGIFDSGLGGLSVLQHLNEQMPLEHYIYVADSANVPYGTKSPEFIVDRAKKICDFLIAQQCKAIVIACNTATAAAAKYLRAHYPLPIIGMEPAVKPAALQTRNKKIGVLATEGTLKSTQFAALLDRFGNDIEVHSQPCHGLPELVEAGEIDTEKTKALLGKYMRPMLDANVDTIVLGCTHYPFLAATINEIAGNQVSLIDTGLAVARHTKDRLAAEQLLRLATPILETARFYTSAPSETTNQVITRLWGKESNAQSLPV